MWRYNMIYKKDANFPYPVLTNTSYSYENSHFMLDVNLQENNSDYRFTFNVDISSRFIKQLLNNKKAKLILVIQSKDNKFFDVDLDDEYIDIPKSRISLSKRTVLQLLIQAKEEIYFNDNDELSSFYNGLRNHIVVPKNAILGFSNTVLFEGSNIKPLELFEKKINPNLKSDIHIELGTETIIIHYKNEDLQFIDSPMSHTLNNHYVYMGLQKALYRFIVNNSQEGESVELDEIEIPSDGLDFKLYNILRSKLVREVSIDNMDEVIYLISDKILEKHAAAIKGLYKDGN